MNKTFLASLAIIGVIFLGVLGLSRAHQNQSNVKVGDYYPVFSIGSSTGVLCGTSSTQLIATSTSRNFLSVSNISPNIVYLSFGGPAALNSGMALYASSTMRLDQNALYAGAIYCIASSNSSTTLLELK